MLGVRATCHLRKIVFVVMFSPLMVRLLDLEVLAQSGDESIVVVYDHDSSKKPTENEYRGAFAIDALFKNSFLSTGLASGTDAINRSLESLMHSIFYALMDNEFRIPMNTHSDFGLDLTRDVYSTRQGPFVVVDKILAGPRYSKELYKVGEVPVVASADAGLDALDIYLRTDAERISEKDSLPVWRVIVNNWFGLVPFLAGVLPPSFDPNELYDPLRRLEAPFVLPLSTSTFYQMPVNGIRSYGVVGGIGMAVDLQSVVSSHAGSALEKLENLGVNFPVGLFRRGEFRISVLRKSEHIAWVSVSNIDRSGANVKLFAGNTVYLLADAIPFYKGIPGVFAPFDIGGEAAWTDRTDRVYEFDMRSDAARRAYDAAVRGDLSLADMGSKSQNHSVPSSGVTFHFRKQKKEFSEAVLNNRNLILVRDVNNQQRSQAEVAITDSLGTYHLLEAGEDVGVQHWDILVGPEDQSVKLEAKIKVLKVEESDNTSAGAYHFEFDDRDKATRLYMYLDVEDRYTTAPELKRYINTLARFSGLELQGLPKLPNKDPVELASRRRLAYFDQPSRTVLRTQARAVHLGRFAASGVLVLDTPALDRIKSTNLDQRWRAVARAFDYDAATWDLADRRSGFYWYAEWASAYTAYLLRLANIRVAKFDAIREGDRTVRAIEALSSATTPLEQREALYQLLNSDHPDRLARVLIELAGADSVPRRVRLFAEPKGDAEARILSAFNAYDGRTFSSTVDFPPEERSVQVDQKLEAFQPQTMRPALQRIEIQSIKLFNRRRGLDKPELVVQISANQLVPRSNARFYIRLVQDGKLHLTNLLLAERVFKVPVSNDGAELILSGTSSPLSGEVYDRLLEYGGPLKLTVAVAQDDASWSDRKNIKFIYENGMLKRDD